MSRSVPLLRIEACSDAPVRGDGAYVLYWMIATRRASYNFALDRALECARELGKPLVVFEAPLGISLGQRSAAPVRHRRDGRQRRRIRSRWYHLLSLRRRGEGEGKGLLEALAERAALVITDEFPCFFLPRMVAAAARKLAVRLEQVDSNGLLPLRATDWSFPPPTHFAASCNVHSPRTSPSALGRARSRRASSSAPRSPRKIVARWPRAKLPELLAPSGLAVLPINHGVQGTPLRGGSVIAREKLRQFVRTRLARYNDDRNQPSRQGTSQLSPYLHFGHLSAHEIFETLARQEGWTDARRAKTASGQREGYWGMGAEAEAFVDQFVTWRELGYNMCHKRADYSEFESLPNWAKVTLQDTSAMRAPTFLRSSSFRAAKPMTTSGTRRSCRWRVTDGCTTTCACCGEEDPRVERDPPRSPFDDDRADEQVLARRAQSQLVHRLFLDARALRSPLGTRAPDLRQSSVHELRQHAS